MKIHHEVLIYLNKVESYFKNAEQKDREYFYTESEADVFYHNLEEIANKNFEEKGTPELTAQQFDNLKREYQEKHILAQGENWINYLNIGIIYLN